MRGKVRMLGQVEGRASQIYKFPLRISFYGAPAFAPRVQSLLSAGGLRLVEPKRRGRGAGAGRGGGGRGGGGSAGRSGGGGSGGGGGGSGGGTSAAGPAMAAEVADDDDEIECVGEKTWEERDRELRSQAIVLE